MSQRTRRGLAPDVVYIRMKSRPHRVDQALASEPVDRESLASENSAPVSVGPIPDERPGAALDAGGQEAR